MVETIRNIWALIDLITNPELVDVSRGAILSIFNSPVSFDSVLELTISEEVFLQSRLPYKFSVLILKEAKFGFNQGNSYFWSFAEN